MWRGSGRQAVITQLALLATHETIAYRLERLWGVDRSVPSGGWWAWRCTCGRDVGAERRAAYSHEGSAERMAAHHRRSPPFLAGAR